MTPYQSITAGGSTVGALNLYNDSSSILSSGTFDFFNILLSTTIDFIIKNTIRISAFPTLHKCVDLGEAYSAAYLTSKAHLMEVDIWRIYSWVSCEMASTIMLSTAKRSQTKKLKKFIGNRDAEGIAIMSLDVLDYSVV